MAQKELDLAITGMTCAACSSRIEKVLNKTEGVEAHVNLPMEKAQIHYDPGAISPSILIETIERLGYGVEPEPLEVDVHGMTCAACSSRIEKVLNKMEGIDEAAINLTNETGKITYFKGVTSQQAIIDRIQKLGYDASPRADQASKSEQKEQELTHKRWQLGISGLLSFPLLLTMFAHLFGLPIPQLLMNPWFQMALATPVQFIIGWTFYQGAYHNLKNGSANMDVLIALGTSAAYFYSVTEIFRGMAQPDSTIHLYFETSAILITLVLVGKYFEAVAKGRTTMAISKLMNLQAKEARVMREEQESMVPVEQVVQGDIVKVKPGEKIPVDGIVINGETTVDESMITGESMPVSKMADAHVTGATINENGTIELRVTHVGQETVLASIVKVVEEAQSSKAPIQRMADVISNYFVPIVLGIAVVTFAVWMLWVSPAQISAALEAAIAVLVIACPCALGLATPTSIMVGSGKGAEQGILFKGGEHLENTYRIDTVVFDKTGTLTNGKPEVTDFAGDASALHFMASAENHSEHPLASAIVYYGEKQGVEVVKPEYFKAIPGSGIEARIEEKNILIGTRKLMESHDVEYEEYEERLKHWENEGKTVMLAAIDQQLQAVAAVADTIKPSAISALKQLKKQNLELVMLTGDQERTARAIADQVGIDTVIAQVIPTEKADHIQALQQAGKRVAMVGDGLNDAPALTVANVGIAIGTGTDVAIEAADVTIMGDELNLIPKAIELSGATMKNIRQNLFWALAYNTAGIPVAAAGLLAPWVAGAAMAFSSVSVVSNSLRLKRIKL
ncbi:heavy metal translocating P-type ATPase [Thalassobacillus sp. CUG 92003]|uniref:heavy metal translocating P-type ATPase n=1 Tax=Thalassobacillus sp. CUG 92003 TaxID=2736641 RepID=UPI0015E6CE08|nr:heavy metal translocating P-type ATPase [Thalassobacillus sp. CUG 92003]